MFVCDVILTEAIDFLRHRSKGLIKLTWHCDVLFNAVNLVGKPRSSAQLLWCFDLRSITPSVAIDLSIISFTLNHVIYCLLDITHMRVREAASGDLFP